MDKVQEAQKADGTISLIISEHKIIMDTGLPKDKPFIVRGLKKHHLTVTDIDYVICIHGDADHISNNNLFPRARLIVGFDIYDGDTVTSMTGHDERSIGVLVDTTAGLVGKQPKTGSLLANNPKNRLSIAPKFGNWRITLSLVTATCSRSTNQLTF